MENNKLDKIVLVVDDETLILQMMSIFFKRKFKACHIAINGIEALKILKENSEIDCVITDISMPEMDGYELKQEIDKLIPTMPVIALTGHSDPEHIERIKELNFKHYVIKPVDRKKIDEMIRVLCE